jgi:fermentation-respiration switch protein FrsA (DUF1100 family)
MPDALQQTRPYTAPPAVDGVGVRDVLVRAADGVVLAGTLRWPTEHPLPAAGLLVSPPGPAGVSDQSVVAGYAERFAAAGYVTLALDPRGFGLSGGQLRQHFDVGDRIRDLQSALTFLSSLIDHVVPGRIGAFGASAGATVALVLAGTDTRIKAFVGACGGYFNPRLHRDLVGSAFDDMRAKTYADLERFHRTGELDYIPVVTPDGAGAFLSGIDPYPTEPFDYYGTERGASERFENRVTVLSNYSLLNNDYLTPASFMGDRAGLLLAGTDDVYVPLAGTQEVHRLLTGPKDLVMVDGANHIDLYDNAPYVTTVTEAATAWFREHL